MPISATRKVSLAPLAPAPSLFGNASHAYDASPDAYALRTGSASNCVRSAPQSPSKPRQGPPEDGQKPPSGPELRMERSWEQQLTALT